MRKRTELGLSIVFMAVLLFISGCNNNDDGQKVYFVDALVVGLEYDCETYRGKTDGNGSFNYGGIGDCSFHLGELSFNASQESMEKGYITPYDVTETPEEAHVLSAILHYVSFDAHNRMILLEKATKKINAYPLDRGNESIIGALGIEETDSYIHVRHAQRLLSKYVNSDNTLKYDIFTMTSSGGDFAEGIAGGVSVAMAEEIGGPIGAYAASTIMSSMGIPGFSGHDNFSKVNAKLDEISAEIKDISKNVDTILGDFDVLFAKLDTKDSNDFSEMYRFIYDGSDNLFDFMSSNLTTADGNYTTLNDYTPFMCAALYKNIFDNSGVILISPSTTPGDRVPGTVLESFAYWHDHLLPSLEAYFSAQQAYLSLIMPEVGNDKNVTGFRGLLDQYNESVLQMRLNVMITVQRLIQLHETALYVTSLQGMDSTKCSAVDFDDSYIPQVQKNPTEDKISRGHDYNTSQTDLENYYEPFVEKLNNFFDSQMISDPIEGKNYIGSTYNPEAAWRSAVDSNFTKRTPETTAKHLPDGAWKDSCLIYQYYGFSDLNATVRGDYNGHYLHGAYCKGNDLSPDKYTLSAPFQADVCNDGGIEAGLYKGNLGCGQNGYNQSVLTEQPVTGDTLPFSRSASTAMYMIHMEIQDSTLVPKLGKKFQVASLQTNENVGTVLQNDQNVYMFEYGNLRNAGTGHTYDNPEIFSLSSFTNEDNNSTNVSSVSSSRFKIRFWDKYWETDGAFFSVTYHRDSNINIQCPEAPPATSTSSECREIAPNLLCINNKDILQSYLEGQYSSHIIYITDKRLNLTPSESLCTFNYYDKVLWNVKNPNVYNNDLLTQSPYR